MSQLFKKGAVLERMGAGLSENLRRELEAAGPDDLNPDQIAALDPALFTVAEYDERLAEATGYSSYSYWRSTFRAFWSNKVARSLLIALCLLILFTLIQPYLPNQKDPAQIFDNENGAVMRNVAPNSDFWFGTNSVGQDLWARIWSGTRTSLLLALIVSVSDCVLGITVGVLWGYVRKLNNLLTEVYNILDNIPRTIILILISYVLRPGMTTMILSMCCVGWLGMARFIRNQIVMIRDRDYNLASRSLGTHTGKIMLRNLLPYLVSVIMLQTALAIPSVISDEVFLTYCGLGMPKNVASLGNLVEEGRQMMMTSSSYQLIFPALVVTFITVAFYLIGNTFADASDPRNHV